MTIRELRAELPQWQWTAKRSGMSWQYVGTMGQRTVRIYAVGRIGQWEDEAEIEWRVEEHRTRDCDDSYAVFWLRENEQRSTPA